MVKIERINFQRFISAPDLPRRIHLRARDTKSLIGSFSSFWKESLFSNRMTSPTNLFPFLTANREQSVALWSLRHPILRMSKINFASSGVAESLCLCLTSRRRRVPGITYTLPTVNKWSAMGKVSNFEPFSVDPGIRRRMNFNASRARATQGAYKADRGSRCSVWFPLRNTPGQLFEDKLRSI